MTTVRTFVRFTFGALFVSALAAGCVVENADDANSDSCDPGSTKSCACGSEAGTKKCNASGTGYGVCSCGNGAGGSESGGTGSEGGSPGSSGGSESSSAGQPGGAGGYGGAAGGDAGGDAGGAPSSAGGAAGGADGGAGGSGSALPAVCTDDADDCETCYHSCCDDWVACTDNATCLSEYFDIIECINTTKADLDPEPFKPEHLAACADMVGTAGGAWSSGLTPQTVAMVNCLGGDPTDSTWADHAAWGADSCKGLCF